MIRVGVCVTPHGFGHGARACAVMLALRQVVDVHFIVLSDLPSWFFEESLGSGYTYCRMATDVGLIQTTAFAEDLPATLKALAAMYPLEDAQVTAAVRCFAGCRLIIADIAPLGIVAAGKLGVPSVLVENFTWDWIYSGYQRRFPGFSPYIDWMEAVYAQATYHVQAAPVCRKVAGAFQAEPLARPRREGREQLRTRLGLTTGQRAVLLTMGGIADDPLPLEHMAEQGATIFFLRSAGRQEAVPENVRVLSRSASFYHPDLVDAVDVVVGKLGSSTLAEVYQAGTPWGYVSRKHFAESVPLARFVEEHMQGRAITCQAMQDGTWLESVDRLLEHAGPRRPGKTGNQATGRFLADLLQG
ncbi:MAG: hypothetical protein CSA34_06310 [Desulfobulbus propionicus]|nr:MAG: hypothetical protein CSA34_06310 [Desulfobulbus propionicus]